jgi:hypothetical protein
MDWFERITGFVESGYENTRSKLAVEGCRLRSLVNDESYKIGELKLIFLRELREAAQNLRKGEVCIQVEAISGDVRKLHQSPQFAGALFQVASQFNLLEMVSPTVTPEQGVTRYAGDPTQGPACAIAAGAATIYRNYFAPVGDKVGQTKDHQLDGLAMLGNALAKELQRPTEILWHMQNGYALCSKDGLGHISSYLERATEDELESLRGELRVGLHSDVEVTDGQGTNRPVVSQIFCSALPVAYSRVSIVHWKSFASLVLQAAYEATMWAAVLNAKRGSSNVVLLTRLGGGAFGNDDRWIYAAMHRALKLVEGYDLRVQLVSHGQPSSETLHLVDEFSRSTHR